MAVKKSPSPPWMQGAKEINNHEMIVVHMKDEELEGLDDLQGGPSIDPETGIREYSALAPIIEMPEIQEVFHHVANELEENGKISPDLHKIYEFSKQHSLPYREAPEEKHNPIRAIEHTGRGGDKKMALIPLNLAFLLIELRHIPTENPKTGLLEFGFFSKIFKEVSRPFKQAAEVIKPIVKPFSEVIRIGGTIGGAMLGGPLGAGVGNALGHFVTGNKAGNSLMSGLKMGALGYGAQGLGQVAGFGGTTPFTGGFFGGAPNALATTIGSAGIGPLGQVMSGAAKTGLSGGAPLAAVGKVAGNASGIGSLLKSIAPFAPLASAALSYKGAQQSHQQERRDVEENNNRIAREREQMGFNRSWSPITRKGRRPNPNFYNRSALEREYGVFPEPAYIEEDNNYAKGGLVKSTTKGILVKGPGKGQDDTIKTSVPDGSYIIDASSTSMFGDGSSKAGSDVLQHFENQVKRKFPVSLVKRFEKEISRKSKQVPVYLSNDERKIDPLTVTLLGNGSNTKGASLLKQMVINLRKHKISKGDELPPKAKHPSFYLPHRR